MQGATSARSAGRPTRSLIKINVVTNVNGTIQKESAFTQHHADTLEWKTVPIWLGA
jgi:hypothetical protein